jgi:hypothetical protein
LIKSEVKIPLQSQANINERYANLVDTKWSQIQINPF